jgi:hypothetical protein
MLLESFTEVFMAGIAQALITSIVTVVIAGLGLYFAVSTVFRSYVMIPEEIRTVEVRIGTLENRLNELEKYNRRAYENGFTNPSRRHE